MRSHVICLWRHSFVGQGPLHHQILPDGCVDIVIVGESRPMVVGPDTKAALVSFEGPTEVLGIRLMPGVAASVLRESVCNILDRTVPLAEFWQATADELHGRLLSLIEWGQKLKLLESVVFDHLSAVDRRIGDAVAALARHPQRRIDELASSYGVTSRHLLRLFETHVGYGPKTLARVFRFQRVLSSARGELASLAELALAAGYADQSHMNREFRQLSSSLPSHLGHRSSTVTMSDLFKTAFGSQ